MKYFMKPYILATFFLISACSQETSLGVSSKQIATNANGKLPAFFKCLRENDVTLVSAHRGGPSVGYPENAIETFERATQSAAVIVELDVVKSEDGNLFVLHDSSLDRTTTMSGRVNEKKWTDIKEAFLEDHLGTATSFHPPSLEETLRWADGRTLLQIDMKPPIDVNEVIEQVLLSKAEGRVFYIVYSIEDAAEVLRKLPNVFVSYGIADQDDLDVLLKSGVKIEQLHALTPDVENKKEFLIKLNEYGITTVGLAFDLENENYNSSKQLNWNDVVKQYQARADSGIEIIASNKPVDAFKALSQNLDYQKALKSCLTGL